MRTLLLAASSLCASVVAVYAQGGAQSERTALAVPPHAQLPTQDVMASRYGNTTIARTGSGHEVHMYYNADHTFTGKVVDVGFDLKGTWSVQNGALCRVYDPLPPMTTNPDCQPVAAQNIGDTWRVGDNTSTLVAGIQ